jgi:hypothetical protein
MTNRWMTRLYILLLVGMTAGAVLACGSADERETLPTPTPPESAQMVEEKQPTPEAEMVEDMATEETMSPETPTPQVQPTPTEVQKIESQPTETPTKEVPPTDTPLAEPEPTEEIQPTDTPAPEPEPTEESSEVILQGQFKDADQNHTGSGTATLFQEPDGSYRLSFENFAVCCGPDLYVFLASNPAPTSHADLGNYVEVSSLQSPTGDQEYEIPAGTDLSQINSVVIYCKPFQVIISTATLD